MTRAVQALTHQPDSSAAAGGISERLARNLAALRSVSPELAKRMTWPVGSDHIDVRGGGIQTSAIYRLGSSRFPLHLSPQSVHALVSRNEGDLARAPSILCLGLGLGELPHHLLTRFPGKRILAVERDPWIARLCLTTFDLSPWIASGAFTLLLSSDCLELAGALASRGEEGPFLIRHPFLGELYAAEENILRCGAALPRALLGSGGLLVDWLYCALRSRGYSVLVADFERLSIEELDRCARRLEPELVVSINYRNGLAEFASRHRSSLLCWEIDPSISPPVLERAAGANARIFCYRRETVRAFAEAGFEQPSYLPLAVDPRERSPIAPASLGASAEVRLGSAPLVFVGSSLRESAACRREEFIAAYVRFRGARDGRERARALLADLCAACRRDYSRWRIPELLAEREPQFAAFCRDALQQDPALLAGELAAAQRRARYARALKKIGLSVFGDEGWGHCRGVDYRGAAGHRRELNAILSGATVAVDIGRLYQLDIVPLRVFEALACETLPLAEHSAELAELFEIGREVESYRTLGELVTKARYFLNNPEDARAIAARGREAVLARHTVDARLSTMLSGLGA
jgi:hypothetical protein